MPIDTGLNIAGQQVNNFVLVPNDVYQCELVDIKMVQEKAWESEELENKLRFIFAVIEEGPYYGAKFFKTVGQKFTTGKKSSNLYILLSGILQRNFTFEECRDAAKILTNEFFNNLIGKQIRLAISQSPGKKDPSKTYNNIDSYLPVKAMLPPFNPAKVKTEDAVGQVAAKPQPDYGTGNVYQGVAAESTATPAAPIAGSTELPKL